MERRFPVVAVIVGRRDCTSGFEQCRSKIAVKTTGEKAGCERVESISKSRSKIGSLSVASDVIECYSMYHEKRDENIPRLGTWN